MARRRNGTLATYRVHIEGEASARTRAEASRSEGPEEASTTGRSQEGTPAHPLLVATRGKAVPEHIRRAACAMADDEGPAAACRRYDVTRPTIKRWRDLLNAEEEQAKKDAAKGKREARKADQFARVNDIDRHRDAIVEAAEAGGHDLAEFIGRIFGGIFQPEGKPVTLSSVYRVDAVQDLGSNTRGFTPGNADRENVSRAGQRMSGERRREVAGR